ncbi:MAG: ZIP family metal transporter [Faecalibacterium sp.]
MTLMHTIWGIVLFPAVCTALGAAVVFCLRKPPRAVVQRAMLGFAAGVMLAASIWSLLLPAIAYAEEGGGSAWVSPVGGFCLGAAGLLLLEHIGDWLLSAHARGTAVVAVGRQGGTGATCASPLGAAQTDVTQIDRAQTIACAPQAGADTETVNAGRVIFAITLHNLPEGMIVGLGAALALAGNAEALVGAAALSLGIGLQNLPEGASVSLPMRQAGRGRFVSFVGGAASGVVEPLGALIALCVAGWVTPLMPWLLAAAAGAMVCVAAEEMIPLAMAKGRVGVISVVVGFALMMAMDVGLG